VAELWKNAINRVGIVILRDGRQVVDGIASINADGGVLHHAAERIEIKRAIGWGCPYIPNRGATNRVRDDGLPHFERGIVIVAWNEAAGTLEHLGVGELSLAGWARTEPALKNSTAARAAMACCVLRVACCVLREKKFGDGMGVVGPGDGRRFTGFGAKWLFGELHINQSQLNTSLKIHAGGDLGRPFKQRIAYCVFLRPSEYAIRNTLLKF